MYCLREGRVLAACSIEIDLRTGRDVVEDTYRYMCRGKTRAEGLVGCQLPDVTVLLSAVFGVIISELIHSCGARARGMLRI